MRRGHPGVQSAIWPLSWRLAPVPRVEQEPTNPVVTNPVVARVLKREGCGSKAVSLPERPSVARSASGKVGHMITRRKQAVVAACCIVVTSLAWFMMHGASGRNSLYASGGP